MQIDSGIIWRHHDDFQININYEASDSTINNTPIQHEISATSVFSYTDNIALKFSGKWHKINKDYSSDIQLSLQYFF